MPMTIAAAKATGSGTPWVTSQAAVMPGSGHGRADREVEAAGDDDDGLADRDDADDGDAPADVEEIGRGEEVGRDESEDRREDDEDGEEAERAVAAIAASKYRRRPARGRAAVASEAASAGGLTPRLRARRRSSAHASPPWSFPAAGRAAASSPAIRPWRTTTMRSQTWRMSVKRWLIIRIETPRALSCSISPISTRIFSAESAAVGSSRSISRGWNCSARATATSWRWPPDSAPTIRSGSRSVPSSRITCRAASCMPARSRNLNGP